MAPDHGHSRGDLPGGGGAALPAAENRVVRTLLLYAIAFLLIKPACTRILSALPCWQR